MEKCPFCGELMTNHVFKDGARFHVMSYYTGKNGAVSHCSEHNCEKNHGRGHCVPQETAGETFVRDHIR